MGSYYGVYDGHGGARCSVYVAHYLHKHVLAWIDAYISHYSSNSQRLINQLLNTQDTFHNISCNDINKSIQSNITNSKTSKSNSNEDNITKSLLNKTIIQSDNENGDTND